MSFPVIVRPRAEANLEEARRWYDERRAGLGAEWVNAVRSMVGTLGDDPERYPLYYRGFRRALLRRFPYKLFYRFEKDRVVVFRILHAKRDHEHP